jgi:hypothetical protein
VDLVGLVGEVAFLELEGLLGAFAFLVDLEGLFGGVAFLDLEGLLGEVAFLGLAFGFLP